MAETNGGSDSPGGTRFKITSPPPGSGPLGAGGGSPVLSTKSNHTANNKSPSPPPSSTSATPATIATPLSPTAQKTDDQMQPRDAVVLSVPSIELPDGESQSNHGILVNLWCLIKLFVFCDNKVVQSTHISWEVLP